MPNPISKLECVAQYLDRIGYIVSTSEVSSPY